MFILKNKHLINELYTCNVNILTFRTRNITHKLMLRYHKNAFFASDGKLKHQNFHSSVSRKYALI